MVKTCYLNTHIAVKYSDNAMTDDDSGRGANSLMNEQK